MSFFRSFLFLCIISLIASAFLFVICSFSRNVGYSGGYAVLSASDSLGDREIRALLDKGENNFEGSVVSESSQWVILDDFGSLETVSLDNYSTRLSAFDPRNDGYAEKLKEVFVRDGKRFFYVPFKSGNFVPANLDRQFKELLGDIPFSADYFGIDKPYALFFIVFAAAFASILLICYVKKNSRELFTNIIALLPPLSCLAFFGAPGIAISALFLGIFFMLREPLNELATIIFSKEKLNKRDKIEKRKLIVKNALEPYRIYWLFLPIFLVSIAFIAIFSQLNILFLLAVCVVSCAIFLLSLITPSFSGANHTRFTPVQIIRRRFVDFSFSTYMLPLILSSFLALFLSPFMSGSLVNENNFNISTIEEQDYYAHLAFQSSFSTRQLGSLNESYPAFSLDNDGLLSMNAKSASLSDFKPEKFPPFPLKHLMDFLNGVNNGGKMKRNTGGTAAQRLSLLVLLIFIFPGFFLRGKISFPQKGQFSGFRGLTRKFFSKMPRMTDKTRKKVLLYNAGNTLHLRKDA